MWAFFGVHKELTKSPLEGGLSVWCPQLVSAALSGVAALMAAGLLTTVLMRLVLRVLAPNSAESNANVPVYPRFVERSDSEKPRALGSI